MLVAARLVQGVAAAAIMPNVLSIIGVTYTGADRVRALAAYGLVLGLAAVGGQLIGGVLVQVDLAGLGWRSVFLINVPIGLAALALAPRLVPESREPGAGRLDVRGTVLVTLGLTAVRAAARRGPRARLAGVDVDLARRGAADPRRVRARAGAPGARGGTPLLVPSLFRERAFSAGLVTQLAFWCGQASFFLVLALYLQQGRGLDALQAGPGVHDPRGRLPGGVGEGARR